MLELVLYSILVGVKEIQMPDFGLVWRAMVDLFPVPIVAIAGLFMTTGFLYFCSLIYSAFGTLQDVYYNRRYNPTHRVTESEWQFLNTKLNTKFMSNEKDLQILHNHIKTLYDNIALLQLVRKETKLNEVGTRGRGLVVEPPVKK